MEGRERGIACAGALKSIRLGRFVTAKSNGLRDLVELIMADVLQTFSFAFELLVDLERLLRHLLVSVFRAAHQREVWTGGDTFVTVVVKANTEHQCLCFLQ